MPRRRPYKTDLTVLSPRKAGSAAVFPFRLRKGAANQCGSAALQNPTMRGWSTFVLETTKLCPIHAALALLIIMAVLVLVAVRWMRRYHRQTLILLRGVAFHMIQNRPPSDDAMRLQENVNWWEREVLKTLPRAGAKS